MNKTLFKEVILRQNLLLKEGNENLIKRECNYKIPTNFVSIIIGVRRCGKSTLATQLLEDSLYLNFDDPILSTFEIKNYLDLIEIINEIRPNVKNLILDEIQEIENWEKLVNVLKQRYTLIITGSNSKLLSKEIATYLTGRYVKYTLYPFSFREYLKYKKIDLNISLREDVGKIKNLLNAYINESGFPESYLVGRKYLVDLYDSIIEKDLINRYNIKYKKSFKELSYYLIGLISSNISFNSIKKYFNLGSVHTVKNYIEYLENSFLIYTVPKFSFKFREVIKESRKVYCVDVGLAKTLYSGVSKDKGKIIENLVFLDLLRRRDYFLRNWEIFYYKTQNGKEIDFVIKENRRVKYLIEICYELDDFNVKNKHINKVFRAMEELKLREGVIITWDDEDLIEKNGKRIKVIPLWKWLLSFH